MMVDARMIQCRYCPEKAFWATYRSTERRTLVDPQPSPNGNLHLTVTEGGVFLVEVIDADQRSRYTALYVSHFATCPGAKTARRPRSKAGRK